MLAAAAHESLNPAGALIMIASVGAVLLLLGYCMYRVLNLPPVEMEESVRGPLGIDTGDTQDAD